MVTPFTTRLTVPLGDGVSGVLFTLIEVNIATVCAIIISAKAKYPSGNNVVLS